MWRAEHINVGKRFLEWHCEAALDDSLLCSPRWIHFRLSAEGQRLYSVPIISIFLVGLLTESTRGREGCDGHGIASKGYFTFFPVEGLHWLHAYFICFCAAVLTMVIGAVAAPKTEAQIAESDTLPEAPVDLTPWAYAKTASVGIVILTVLMYVGLQSLAA